MTARIALAAGRAWGWVWARRHRITYWACWGRGDTD